MRPYRLFVLLGGSAAICAAWTIVPSSAVCQDSRKTAKLSTEVHHCQTAKKDSPRRPCYKEGNSSGPMSQQRPAEPRTWQLARTPDPARGRESFSITKIAERSTAELAVAITDDHHSLRGVIPFDRH
jgi:hypothetical protein